VGGSGGYLQPFIDTTEQPGRVLLRFSTAIGNMGAGPAILRSASGGTPPASSGLTSWINPDGTQNVLQEIYTYNPGNNTFTFNRYRPAGRFTYHQGHGHFHYDGYAEYRLLQNVGGQPGPLALRSDGTATVGEKVGFCLINVSSSFTLPGGGSSTTLPGYSAAQPSTSCGFLQGIHVGRVDVYSSSYDGQWVDVTGVAPGNYFLEVTLDASNALLETNDANNTVYVPVTLTNTTGGNNPISPDRFESMASGGPNNTFDTATNLGVLGVSTEPGLTFHAGADEDFFRFEAASSGSYNVQVVFTNRDVDLWLYDGNRNLIRASTTDQIGTTSSPASETITHNFVAGQTYFLHARGRFISGGNETGGLSSNYSLRTFINPTVNAGAPDTTASEVNGEAGQITLTRNGPFSTPLNVNFTTSGTAARGEDYNIFMDGVLIPASTNTVTIGVEALTAHLDIVPIADNLIEGTETAILTITSSTAYVVGGTNSATVQILDTPPAVTGQSYGFEALPLGVRFDFTLPVGASLDVNDVQVLNLDTREVVPVQSVAYDAGTNRGSFLFAGVLPDGNYTATLVASGVTHALGTPLAADASFDFFAFAGDANRDRSVDIADFSVVAANFNGAGTFSQGDFDYSGTVDIADFSVVAARFNTSLPLARPAPRGSVPGGSASVPAVPFGQTAIGLAERVDLVSKNDVL
jgi:hypothetical protein